MKLKHILSFFIPIAIGISACNGDAKKEITNQDSITQSLLIDSAAVQKELNKYLIEPPDTNYSGDYLTKWENGNTKFKGFFRFGKRHGQWLAFYANGNMWSECFYDKGLRHGANRVFFENGTPRYNGWFKNDLRDSLWVFFNENGAEVKHVWFKNDEEQPASK